DGAIDAGGDVGIEIADNVFATSIAEAGVVGAADFHLADGSPARGAGRDVRAMGFATDLDGRPRPMPPSAGAYEHAADAPDAAPLPPDAGAGPRTDAGAGPRTDAGAWLDGGATSEATGGCSCRVAPRRAPSALWAALALLAWWVRRRR